MQIGMIGLGRMGGNMVRRLLAAGHHCVVFSQNSGEAEPLRQAGATVAASLAELASKLDRPRAVWIMIPAAAVDPVIHDLTASLGPGDVLIDGGNSHYVDDV